MLSESDIRRIVARIVEGYGPLVVGTFGSYAVGTATARSDLDIVVIKQTAETAGARRQAVTRLLFGILHPLDVQVFTTQEFEDEVNDEHSFIWVIAHQARIYHFAEEAAIVVPSLATRRAYTAKGER